jgi:hypothetical protein
MSYGDPSGSPNPFSSNPYQTPSSSGFIAPPPSPGADLPMILGIISIALGVGAIPLTCCCLIGVVPGGLAAILGIVALMMPARPGSPAKMLGIGGIVLGLVSVLWFAFALILAATNPQPPNRNNNNPFQNIQIPVEPDEGEK